MAKPAGPPAPPAKRFRDQIEAALLDGVALEAMTLKLTMGDAHKLKRDTSLAIADISFAGGVMRFLGVAIQQGGVAESQLELS